MHAIIRRKYGEHYLSAVFGYFWYRLTPEERKKYKADDKELPWLWYRIVWDPEKKRLIKLADIEHRIIIIDTDQSDWDKNKYGMGCVDFLSKELLDSFLDAEVQPPEIFEKCREVDAGFIFNETPEIKTQTGEASAAQQPRCKNV